VAEDDATGNQDARTAVRQRMREVDDRMPIAEESVRLRAKEVAWLECQPTLATLLDEFAKAQTHVAELRAVLRAIWRFAPPANSERPSASNLNFALGAAPVDLLVPTEVETAWRAAFEALQRDAGAKLPK
jgi:hypothetical protein